MLLAKSTPRVNFELLERYINRKVLLVGLLDQADAGKARIKAADGGTVTVTLKDGNTQFEKPYVEILGTVTSPSSLAEESRTNFGNSFDMATYNELCKIAATDFPDIFG